MLLNGSYFSIIKKNVEGSTFVYEIQLNATHEIYNGHFPGNPISPGVCSIETIRECCEDALNRKLTLKTIKQCRFITLLTPKVNGTLALEINITESDSSYIVVANLTNNDTTFVNFKGSFEPK